ncbi:uncharacterized protein LOC131888024 [Tigriopus californicus]|uniref:uncharacterized protein LOC131888024 n=1 Tax=Tigriopus californicus TaxID=6832 RepID=UPI0027DA731C|nr:uncharacterized protein LOC131888024 [Tigriopus californicus]
MAFRFHGHGLASEHGSESFSVHPYGSPLQSGPVASSTNPAPTMPIGHWKRQLRESGVATCVHPQCQINFLSLAGIVAHSKTCSGYAPAGDFVPCNVCGLRFKQYKSMQSHRDRNHYQVVGVAPPAPPGNLLLKEVSQYSAFGPNTTVYVAETEPTKPVVERRRPNVLQSYSRGPRTQGTHAQGGHATPKIEDHTNVSYLPPDIAQEVLAPTYSETVDETQKAAIASRLIAESHLISNPRPAGRPVTYYTPRKPASTVNRFADPFDMNPTHGTPQYELNPPKVEPSAHPGYQTVTLERQDTPRRQTQLKPIYIDSSPGDGRYYEVSSSNSGSTNGKQYRYIDVGSNESGGRRIIFANSNLTITQQQPQPPPTPVSLASSAGSEVSSYSTTPSPAILSESGQSLERESMTRPTEVPVHSSSAQPLFQHEGSPIVPTSSLNEITRPVKMSPKGSSEDPSPICAVAKSDPSQPQASSLSEMDLRERELADEEAKLAEYERIVLESEEKAKEARRKRLEEREAQLKKRKEALHKRHLQAVASIEPSSPKVEVDVGAALVPFSEAEVSLLSNTKNEPPSSSSQEEISPPNTSVVSSGQSDCKVSNEISYQNTPQSHQEWSVSCDFVKEQAVVPVETQEEEVQVEPFDTSIKAADKSSNVKTSTVSKWSSDQFQFAKGVILPREISDESPTEEKAVPLSIPRSIPVELITTHKGSDGSIQTFSEMTEIIPEGIALDPGAKVLHISTDGFTETVVLHSLERDEERHSTPKKETKIEEVEPPHLQEPEVSSGSKGNEPNKPEHAIEPEVAPEEMEPEIEQEVELEVEPEVIQVVEPEVVQVDEAEVEPEVVQETDLEDEPIVEPEVEQAAELEVEPEIDQEIEPEVEQEIEPNFVKEVEAEVEVELEQESKESEPNTIVQNNEAIENTDCDGLMAFCDMKENDNEELSVEMDNQINEDQQRETPIEPQQGLDDSGKETINQNPTESKPLDEEETVEREQDLQEDDQPLERKRRRRTTTKTPVRSTKIQRKPRTRKSLEANAKPEIVVQTPRSRRAQKRPNAEKVETVAPKVKRKSPQKPTKIEPQKCVGRSKKKQFQCGKCEHIFWANRQYEIHTAVEHSGLARLIGENQEFTTKERDQALRNAFKLISKVKCHQEQCDRVFTSYAGLQYHLRTCQKSPDEIESMKVKCSLCEYRGLPINMRQHELRHQTYLKTSPNKEDPDNPSQQAENRSEETNDTSLTQSGRKRRRAATKASAKVNEAMKILKTKEEGDVSDIGDKDGDDDQDEVFNVAKAVDIKAHYKINKKEKKFSCQHCQNIFNTRSKIESHLMSNHSEEMDDGDADEDEGFPEEEISDGDFSLGDETEEVSGRQRKSLKYSGRPRNRLEKSSVLSSTTDLIPFESKFRQANFDKNPFSDFHSTRSDWTVFNQDQAQDWLPESIESLPFNSRHCSETTDNPTKTSLKLFQSTEAKSDDVVTFFVGGPIRASAWLPMSDAKSEWAYLAVSAVKSMSDGQTFVTSAQTGKGLIQIWRVHVQSLASEMVMGLSHDLGTIWDLEWVPSGNQIQSEDPCHLERLGVLACASSEGTIRVFSICLFSELENPVPGSPLICQTESKRTLRLCHNPDPDDPSKSACVTLSWFRGQNHRVLAGGFCDGRYALWDLFQPDGSLQRQGQDIYPYLHQTAHTAGITALDLSDSPSFFDPDFPRELVTGSYDRGVAVWDLDHPSLPIQFLRKGLVMGLDWLRHHAGEVMVSFDDVFLQSHTQSVVFDFASPNVKAHPVMAHNSAVWSQSTSPWLNVMATATTAGEVILFLAPPLTRALENDKDTNRRRIYLYTTEVFERPSKPVEVQSNDDFGDVKEDSLEFVDVATRDIRALSVEIQKKTRYFETMPMEDITRYPIRSVNQIRLNPNPQTLGLVFSGTQAGFGRVHLVESLLNADIRSQLKKHRVS